MRVPPTQTKKIYQQVFERLVRQSGLRDVLADGGAGLCDFLARRVASGEISWTTAKQYASAVRSQLRAKELSTEAFEQRWKEARKLAPKGKRKRKSGRKVKITQDVVDTLMMLAGVKASANFVMAVSLFHGGIAMGLRPCEWAGSRWIDDAKTGLLVANAKTASRLMTYGPFEGRVWSRGNGTERCLLLTEEGVERGTRELVDTILDNEKDRPWVQHRTAYWRSFKTLVGEGVRKGVIEPKFRNLTIYSSRHQFAADAKKVFNVSGGELAGAMGHISVRTAVSGYGRRSVGGSFSPAVRPDVPSVEAVQSKELRPSRPVVGTPPTPSSRPEP